jgi:hypothetical protein
MEIVGDKTHDLVLESLSRGVGIGKIILISADS